MDLVVLLSALAGNNKGGAGGAVTFKVLDLFTHLVKTTFTYMGQVKIININTVSFLINR